VKIRPVGAQLFHADGRTYRQTWWDSWSLFLILRRRLKTESNIVATIYNFANITAKHRKARMVRKVEEIWCRVRIHYFNIFAISKAVGRLKQLSLSNNDVKNIVQMWPVISLKKLEGKFRTMLVSLGTDGVFLRLLWWDSLCFFRDTYWGCTKVLLRR